MAVAGGLIVIIVSAKSYDPHVALREISEIIELKRVWSLDWLNGKCFSRYAFPLSTSSTADPHSDAVFWWRREDSTAPVAIPGALHWTKPGTNSDTRMNFVFPNASWTIPSAAPDWSPEQFPKTLAEFRDWWAFPGFVRRVDLILEVNSHGYILDDFTHPELGYVFATGPKGTRAKTVFLRPMNIASPLAGKNVFHDPVNITSTERLGDPPQQYETGFQGTVPGSSRFVYFPATRFVVIEISQEKLVSLFSHWRTGKFDRSFADLSLAAKDLDFLELSDIQKFISDDLGKGGEVFEAFGMKFPAGQISFWGVAAVLSVQTYFLLYLRQLHGRLKADDAGWDVPWIGMNQSRAARCLLFATVVILPAAAIGLLGTTATIHLAADFFERTKYFIRVAAVSGNFDLAILGKISGFATALALAIILGRESWKYRPQISPEPPSSPPQLFE
jgi:hypothetical protein